ncbi:MAG TPA: hypothetical protein VKU39_17745 [Streptosporangiaceae bacterium]|nr:hypothetical protein [Streptosporangiaceae bacterium]
MEGFASLLDDAAVFPPGPAAQGGAPLTAALPAHRAHRAAWYSPLLGPFVFPAGRISELSDPHNEVPLHVALTGTGSGGLRAALEPVPSVRLTAVELVPDGEDLVALFDDQLPGEVTGYVEVPRGPGRDVVLDALAGTRYRAKFRTGGLVPRAHPSEAELAESILAAVSRGVPFKCTAGLHHAVRLTAPSDEGDLEQHGFLNVLLATAAALDGASAPDLAALLAQRDAATVAAQVQALGEAGVARARERFVSFGTCSIDDPVRDLTDLKLIEDRAA